MDGTFRVGEWQVEPQLNLIADGTRTMHVEPKVMRVLVYLAEHTGGVGRYIDIDLFRFELDQRFARFDRLALMLEPGADGSLDH